MTVVGQWTGESACRLKAALRLTNEAFADTLGVGRRTVADWRQRPHVVLRPDIQQALDVLLERSSPAVQERFAGAGPPPTRHARGGFGVRSHKFIPAYIGAAGAERITGRLGARPAPDLIGGHAAAGDLHLWPHGIAVAHVVEDRQFATLTELAAWRYRTYPANLTATSERLTALAGSPIQAGYVLSTYWIHTPGWDDAEADAAVRILCSPRVLWPDDATADPATEGHLLAEGFTQPGLSPFGVAGAAIGYASWGGVAYLPLDLSRALAETNLVDVELSLQAVWAYCGWVTEQIERGLDPPGGDAGWRWLRAARSMLLTPRPQEATPHRSMREAIVLTSGLPDMIQEAMSALREVPA